MPPAGSRPPLPDSGSGNRMRELGSGISDPRSARPSMGRNEFAPQDSSVSSPLGAQALPPDPPRKEFASSLQ